MNPSHLTIYYLFYCFLLINLTTASPYNYQQFPSIFIDRFSISNTPSPSSLYYNGATLTALGMGPHTYNYAWRKNLTAVVSYGLSVHNYKMFASGDFSYTIQFLNVTITGCKVQLQSFSTDWIGYLTFNAVVTTSNVDVELIQFQSSLPNLNPPIRTVSKQVFYLTSSKFNFTGPQIFASFFNQWIRYNEVSTNIKNLFFLKLNTTLNTNLLSLTVDSYNGFQNSLHSFKVNVLLVNCTAFSPTLTYYTFNWLANPNTTSPINFNLPSQFGHPLSNYTCFFSLNGFERQKNYASQFYFIDLNGDLDNITVSTLPDRDISIAMRCLMVCPLHTFVDYTNNTSLCLNCTDYIDYCLNCTSQNNCIACLPTAALINGLCYKCIQYMVACQQCVSNAQCTQCYIGKIVTGGCTKVPGCTLVMQIYTPAHEAVCVDCDSLEFIYNFKQKACDCRVGWLVGYYCTTIYGCTNTKKIGYNTVCISCNSSLKYELQNNTCVCSTGYHQNSTGVCQDACGDGLLLTVACDDGNLNDGDGCSHDCKVQVFYKCNNTGLNPSECFFIGLDINVTLTKTKKIEGESKVVFSFTFKPKLLNLAKLNLSNYFLFNCDNSNYSILSWTLSDGIAYLTLDYRSRLEDRSASVNFTFDQYFVKHQSILVDFIIQGDGTKLLYYDFNSKLQVLKTIMFVISVFAFFFLIVGTWVHKMVGIEYIFLLQIVYYSHFGLLYYNQCFGILQYLAPISLNYRAQDYESINFQFNKLFTVLGSSLIGIQRSLLSTCIFIVFLFILFGLVQMLYKKQCTKSKFFKLIGDNYAFYTNIISPLLLSFTLPLFCVTATLLTRNTSDQPSDISGNLMIISALCLFLFFVYSFNFSLNVLKPFVGAIKNFKVDFEVRQAKTKIYLPLFLLTMLASFVCLWFWLRFNIVTALYVLVGVLLVMCIWQVVERPYFQIIDNIGIIINMLIAVLFLSIVALQNHRVIQLQNDLSNLVVLFIASMLILSFLLSSIRLIYAAVLKNRANTQKDNQKQDQKEKSRQQDFSIQQKKDEQLHYKEDLAPLKKPLLNNRSIFLSEAPSIFQINEAYRQIKQTRQLDSQFTRQLQKHKQQFRLRKLNTRISNE